LNAGDYEVAIGALVERKTVRGLHASVIAGTFWPQIGRLRESGHFCYLLLEGHDLYDGPVGDTAVRGICIALMDLGVHVLRSVDAMDSARWLDRLAERRTNARYRSRAPHAQRPKRRAGVSAAEAALSCVPGISSHHARVLLTRFGTLAATAQASREQWLEVSGIGVTRANALETTFRANHNF
jgi:DNA excision repair protein ERCC-4/Fanconi anemia group M protein